MSQTDFLPVRENELRSWSYAFSMNLNLDPESYGVPVETAAAYAVLNDEFAALLTLTQWPESDTTVNRAAKNRAKAQLIQAARQIVRQINGTPGITDEQRARLQLTIASDRSRIVAPAERPMIFIEKRRGARVTIRLTQPDGATSRRKPEGVYGATIFSYTGAQPPESLSEWMFHESTTRSKATLIFERPHEAGTKVWITAFWLNPRLQRGPAARPISTYIEPGAMEMDRELRIAA